MMLCEICGNELEPGTTTCPFCGARVEKPLVETPFPLQRTINLEAGMPTVAMALKRLEDELTIAEKQHYRLLTLIHGYGSSGKGGAIRTEVRRQLQYLKLKRRINELVPGEEFSTRTGPGRQLLRRFPALATHPDLNRHNRGITLVVL